MNLNVKSIYEEPLPEDGKRLLVELFWPRGVWKQRAELEAWVRDVAPGVELSRRLSENKIDFDDFRAAYTAELEGDPVRKQAAEGIRNMIKKNLVTLLYASGDAEMNSAKVLRGYLDDDDD